MHANRICLLPGLLTMLCLCACSVNPVTGDLDIVTLSEKKEIAIGKKMHEDLVKNNALYDNPELQQYIQNIGEKLASHSHRNKLTYSFNVIDNPGVNAFALPGGYIYLNRGLLAYLKDEHQLAAVLAHELGHVTARHSVRQKTASTANSLLSVITLIGTGSADLANATHKGGRVLVSGYGREHELEADRLGAEYLHSAGYNKHALLDVIGILKNQERYSKARAKAQGKKIQTYHGVFSTHPRNDKRLQHIIIKARALTQQTPQNIDPADFRHAVAGLTYGKTPEKLVRAHNRFYHNKLNFTFSYPQGWKVTSSKQTIVVSAPDNTARLELQVKRVKNAQSPREFLTQEASINTLFRSENLQQYGLEGHTGIQPGNARHNARRIAVLYYRNLAYIMTGSSKKADQDKHFLEMITSFRPMRHSERKLPKTAQIKYIQCPPGMRYAQLARSSKIRIDAENQLRLLNGHYPKGEPAAGEWIKIIE